MSTILPQKQQYIQVMKEIMMAERLDQQKKKTLEAILKDLKIQYNQNNQDSLINLLSTQLINMMREAPSNSLDGVPQIIFDIDKKILSTHTVLKDILEQFINKISRNSAQRTDISSIVPGQQRMNPNFLNSNGINNFNIAPAPIGPQFDFMMPNSAQWRPGVSQRQNTMMPINAPPTSMMGGPHDMSVQMFNQSMNPMNSGGNFGFLGGQNPNIYNQNNMMGPMFFPQNQSQLNMMQNNMIGGGTPRNSMNPQQQQNNMMMNQQPQFQLLNGGGGNINPSNNNNINNNNFMNFNGGFMGPTNMNNQGQMQGLYPNIGFSMEFPNGPSQEHMNLQTTQPGHMQNLNSNVNSNTSNNQMQQSLQNGPSQLNNSNIIPESQMNPNNIMNLGGNLNPNTSSLIQPGVVGSGNGNNMMNPMNLNQMGNVVVNPFMGNNEGLQQMYMNNQFMNNQYVNGFGDMMRMQNFNFPENNFFNVPVPPSGINSFQGFPGQIGQFPHSNVPSVNLGPNSMALTGVPNINIPKNYPTDICYCLIFPRFKDVLPQTFLKDKELIECQNKEICKRKMHRGCARITTSTQEKAYEHFECPSCILKKIDPLNEVVQILSEPQILADTGSSQVQFVVNLNEEIYQKLLKQDSGFFIEIRSLKIDFQLIHDITWPDFTEIFLNSTSLEEFKPIPFQSSLKQRKDEKITLNHRSLNLLKPLNNQSYESSNFIRVREIKNSNESKDLKLTENCPYLIGIYLVKKLLKNDLFDQIIKNQVISEEDSKNQIRNNFLQHRQEGGAEIAMDSLFVNLNCFFDLQMISTPARGRFCTHVNCFSLENMISIMQGSQFRQWKCPICQNKAFDLVVDGYLLKILNQLKEQKINAKDIIFDVEANYQVGRIINEDSDQDIDDNMDIEKQNEKATDKPNQQHNKPIINLEDDGPDAPLIEKTVTSPEQGKLNEDGGKDNRQINVKQQETQNKEGEMVDENLDDKPSIQVTGTGEDNKQQENQLENNNNNAAQTGEMPAIAEEEIIFIQENQTDKQSKIDPKIHLRVEQDQKYNHPNAQDSKSQVPNDQSAQLEIDNQLNQEQAAPELNDKVDEKESEKPNQDNVEKNDQLIENNLEKDPILLEMNQAIEPEEIYAKKNEFAPPNSDVAGEKDSKAHNKDMMVEIEPMLAQELEQPKIIQPAVEQKPVDIITIESDDELQRPSNIIGVLKNKSFPAVSKQGHEKHKTHLKQSHKEIVQSNNNNNNNLEDLKVDPTKLNQFLNQFEFDRQIYQDFNYDQFLLIDEICSNDDRNENPAFSNIEQKPAPLLPISTEVMVNAQGEEVPKNIETEIAGENEQISIEINVNDAQSELKKSEQNLIQEENEIILPKDQENLNDSIKEQIDNVPIQIKEKISEEPLEPSQKDKSSPQPKEGEKQDHQENQDIQEGNNELQNQKVENILDDTNKIIEQKNIVALENQKEHQEQQEKSAENPVVEEAEPQNNNQKVKDAQVIQGPVIPDANQNIIIQNKEDKKESLPPKLTLNDQQKDMPFSRLKEKSRIKLIKCVKKQFLEINLNVKQGADNKYASSLFSSTTNSQYNPQPFSNTANSKTHNSGNFGVSGTSSAFKKASASSTHHNYNNPSIFPKGPTNSMIHPGNINPNSAHKMHQVAMAKNLRLQEGFDPIHSMMGHPGAANMLMDPNPNMNPMMWNPMMMGADGANQMEPVFWPMQMGYNLNEMQKFNGLNNGQQGVFLNSKNNINPLFMMNNGGGVNNLNNNTNSNNNAFLKYYNNSPLNNPNYVNDKVPPYISGMNMNSQAQKINKKQDQKQQPMSLFSGSVQKMKNNSSNPVTVGSNIDDKAQQDQLPTFIEIQDDEEQIANNINNEDNNNNNNNESQIPSNLPVEVNNNIPEDQKVNFEQENQQKNEVMIVAQNQNTGDQKSQNDEQQHQSLKNQNSNQCQSPLHKEGSEISQPEDIEFEKVQQNV